MSRNSRLSLGVAVVAAASLGVTGLGAGTAISSPHVTRAVAPTPKLTVSATKKTLHVKGPRSFQPGTVALQSVGGAFEVASFKSGYSFKKFVKDLKATQGQNKAALKHLNHAIDNTTLYGGIGGKGSKGTVSLDKPGAYYVYNDSGNNGVPIGQPVKLTVSGSLAHRAPTGSSATVKAKSTDRWGGDSTLPSKGTITFKNVSKGKTKSPHFIELDHVKKGTTRKEIIDYLQSGASGQPPFALSGSMGTDAVSPGHSMTASVNLPKGSYALMCFFPDPITGMPHAFMGMVKIVTLK